MLASLLPLAAASMVFFPAAVQAQPQRLVSPPQRTFANDSLTLQRSVALSGSGFVLVDLLLPGGNAYRTRNTLDGGWPGLQPGVWLTDALFQSRANAQPEVVLAGGAGLADWWVSDIITVTGRSLTSRFDRPGPVRFVSATNREAPTARSSLSLAFGSSSWGSGLTFTSACREPGHCLGGLARRSEGFEPQRGVKDTEMYDLAVLTTGTPTELADGELNGSPVVPEPSTWLMLFTGLLGVAVLAWSRNLTA